MADLELIKTKLDIVDVIQSYLPELKKAGANYKTNCPFHSEKTASFTVNQNLQIFKCFGCGKAGDVIKFIQEMERVDFREAITIAAEKAGVDIQELKYQDKDKDKKQRLIYANTLTAKFYHHVLLTHPLGKPGLAYAKKREIDLDRINQFTLGFAPKGYDNLKKFLVSKGYKEQELAGFGLLVERNGKYIDKFRERLMQPIFNMKGEIVAFSGRYIGTVKEAPKYLNSPETLVYKKGDILYGLYQAKNEIRKSKDQFGEEFLILEEGNIDILSSHRVGIGNIVAPLGTAFTINQAKLISKYAEYIYFCFDTDLAGLSALVRGIAIAEETGIKHKVIDIVGFQDPDDMIKNDPKKWIDAISNPKNSVEYLIERFALDLDLGKIEGKTKLLEKMTPVLQSVKDEMSRNYYIKNLASLIDAKEEVVQNKIQNSKFENRKLNLGNLNEDRNQEDLQNLKESNYNEETYLLALLLKTEKWDDYDINLNFFSNEELVLIYQSLRDMVDFNILSAKLSDSGQKVLENVLMHEVEIEKPEEELKTIFKSFKYKGLKKRVTKLKKQLKNDEDNETVLQELEQTLTELRGLK